MLPYGQMSLWGILMCLKCLFNILIYLFSYLKSSFLAAGEGSQYSFGGALFNMDIYYLIMPLFTTNKNKIKGLFRIGPHDKDILSIIFGSLLGDAHAEKRKGGTGTRISFYQEETHLSYLLWLHGLLASKSYCNKNHPKIQTRLGSKGIVRKTLRFHTWTYTSFNFIHELFYNNNIKKVPYNIGEYLTPLALAIWIMDDGSKVNKGLKLSTNSFSYSDCLILVKVLHDNFNLKVSIQSAGAPNQYILYIWKESMDQLREIISDYIIPEMKYKIIK